MDTSQYTSHKQTFVISEQLLTLISRHLMSTLTCALMKSIDVAVIVVFLDFSSRCFFTCPPYNYHQDDDVITIIIDVADIALDSVSLGFKKNKVSYCAY